MDAELEAWKAENGYMETSAIQAEIRAILSNPTAPSQETWDRYHKLRNWVNVPFPERFRQLNKSRPFVDEAFADELKEKATKLEGKRRQREEEKFQRKVKSMPPEVQEMIAARTLKAKLREFKQEASQDIEAYMNLSPDEKRIPAFFEAAMQNAETSQHLLQYFALTLTAAPPSIRSNKKLMLQSAKLLSRTLDYVSDNLKADIDVVAAAALPTRYHGLDMYYLGDEIKNDPKLLAGLFNNLSKRVSADNKPITYNDSRGRTYTLLVYVLECLFDHHHMKVIRNPDLWESKEYILEFMSALEFDNTKFYNTYYESMKAEEGSKAQDPEIIAAFRAKGLDI